MRSGTQYKIVRSNLQGWEFSGTGLTEEIAAMHRNDMMKEKVVEKDERVVVDLMEFFKK